MYKQTLYIQYTTRYIFLWYDRDFKVAWWANLFRPRCLRKMFKPRQGKWENNSKSEEEGFYRVLWIFRLSCWKEACCSTLVPHPAAPHRLCLCAPAGSWRYCDSLHNWLEHRVCLVYKHRNSNLRHQSPPFQAGTLVQHLFLLRDLAERWVIWVVKGYNWTQPQCQGHLSLC